MIAAASVLPIVILSGSAVDVGRMMLVRNRLQQSCDAGALAYRRSMNGNNVTNTTESTARSFFNTNFNNSRYGSRSQSISFTLDSSVVVHATATASVPMLIMGMFGNQAATLTTRCDAQMQLPNSDIMFVLDTTGSMTDTNPGDSVTKISALRTAVINFYNAVEKTRPSTTQVRYGFVPYSNTVNVGTLLKREWMVDSATYQSRQFDHQTSTITGYAAATLDTWAGWVQSPTPVVTYSTGNPENCVAAASDTYTNTPFVYGAWSPSATALPRSRTVTTTSSGYQYGSYTNNLGACTTWARNWNGVTQTNVETVSANPGAGQPTYWSANYWNYKPVTYDVSVLKGNAANGLITGGTLNIPTQSPAINVSNPPTAGVNLGVTWDSSNACIEERKTLRPGETGIAYDMDPDLVPTPSNPNTQWRPFIPLALYMRNVTNWPSGATDARTWGWSFATSNTYIDFATYWNNARVAANCPSAARKLQSKANGLTLSALTTYVNSLSTGGDTYHDIGFLWGLRLISAQGLFAAENSAATPNGGDISRNIIFMTDGQTETQLQEYDAYGLSALDRRRTDPSTIPTDDQQNAIVESRLLQYCAVAKAKGMTVWVVAFGTSLNDMMRNCASTNRAYQANNASELNSAFTDIANRIAQLRLTA